MAPTVDNTFDLGSSTKRFNDIYAETLQGTAVLSDNLTITGNSGDVLTFNGSTWVASAPTGGGGGGNAGVPQTLTISGATLSISGGNSVTLPNAVDLDPYVRLDQSQYLHKITCLTLVHLQEDIMMYTQRHFKVLRFYLTI